VANTSGNQRCNTVKPSHAVTAFTRCAIGQIFVNNPANWFQVPTQHILRRVSQITAKWPKIRVRDIINQKVQKQG